MKRTLSALAVALALSAFAGVTAMSVGPAVAQQKKKGDKPLTGTIRYKKIGGYSYKSNDTVPTGATYKFIDPDYSRQGAPSGPFDNGFFFDSGIGPHGGQSPYQN
jgi:hypothetical protein